ncbi:MAG TPA: hypothetical protein QF764_14510 [Planctomycetota bacterium]|nr:hypothetical protein [Planctomycetota bacterium]HJP02975.1 hypothetical protein [Planctomycetota bacterium]
MQHPKPVSEPQQQRALILERWNSWARVWLPATGESRWIDLETQTWAQEGASPAPEREAPTPDAGTG